MEQIMAMLLQLRDTPASALGTGTIEERRAAAEALADLFALPDDLSVEQVSAGGVPADLVTMPGAAADRFLLYLHGGAYVAYSPRTHRELAARIGRGIGTGVLMPDYRLAPEHPHPAAVEDAVAAYRWLVDERGVAPERLFVAGDSAGGGLTMATLLRLRDGGVALPAAAVLISPWVDLAGTGTSYRARADVDPMLQPDRLSLDGQAYAGGRPLTDPLVSPLYADLAGLPRLLVQVGTEEILFDDAIRLVDAARAAGVEVELDVEEGLFHVFQAVPDAPEAIAATDRIAAFLAR